MLPAYQEIMEGRLAQGPSQASELTDPIGVGAVGGSATRLLQQILADAGVAMASPLNRAGDAYEWPPWRKLLHPDMIARHGREALVCNTLQAFERLLLQRRTNLGLTGRAGWKVPGTFHWLAELGGFFPGFQYLHLVRHGLDMAYSGNQNQARNWAGRLGLELRLQDEGRVHPQSMLEYWLTANEKALEDAGRHLPGRLLVVRFEDLCHTPLAELDRILSFLDLQLPAASREALAGLVRTPASAGRYRQRDWRGDFTAQQLERLAALGYTP